MARVGEQESANLPSPLGVAPHGVTSLNKGAQDGTNEFR